MPLSRSFAGRDAVRDCTWGNEGHKAQRAYVGGTGLGGGRSHARGSTRGEGWRRRHRIAHQVWTKGISGEKSSERGRTAKMSVEKSFAEAHDMNNQATH